MNWRHAIPPSNVRTSPWFELLPSREKEIIGYHITQAKIKHTALVGFEASQRIDRTSISHDGVVNALTPGNIIWLVEDFCLDAGNMKSNRLVIGNEALSLQGFPTAWIANTPEDLRPSDPQQMDLAGNAFTSTIIMAIAMCIFFEIGPIATHP